MVVVVVVIVAVSRNIGRRLGHVRPRRSFPLILTLHLIPLQPKPVVVRYAGLTRG